MSHQIKRIHLNFEDQDSATQPMELFIYIIDPFKHCSKLHMYFFTLNSLILSNKYLVSLLNISNHLASYQIKYYFLIDSNFLEFQNQILNR